MAGKLSIHFLSLPDNGDSFNIDLRYLSNTGLWSSVSLRVEFVGRRARNGQVTIDPTVSQLASNFVRAFNTDYGSTGGSGNLNAKLGFVDQDASATVDIDLSNLGWEFVGISGSLYFIEYTMINEETFVPPSVDFTGYDLALSSCETIEASFDLTGGTGLYNAYVNGFKVEDSQPSPLKITLLRNSVSLYNFRFTDTAGKIIGSLSFKTPLKVSSDKININIAYTPSGASVSVNVGFISKWILPLTYSIDGINFSEQNVFTGQLEGDHTVYVKDAFGCVESKDFTIDGFSTTVETNFQISDINPIRYAQVEEGKLNRYNTLSHEQLKNVAYPFIQNFLEKDNPITQIKTNAKYLNIFAFDCDGNQYPLIPVQRSNHLGRTFKTSAVKFSTDDNKTGVYFGVVDVLDILTGSVLESKDFGYQVPTAFGKVGSFVNLGGEGLMKIDSIIYDENYEAFILKFDVAYTGEVDPTTVEATYNIQDYEIYEFVANMSQLPDSFNIAIEAGPSASDIKFTYMSEKIERVQDNKDLAEIIYWHTKNLGGMNYATGVVHTLRLHSVLSRLADTQSIEGYNGDVERYNTGIEIFDGEEFIFLYLSEEMVRKLRLILTHDRLFINGVLYRLGDEVPELTSRFTTNICELSAVLRKGGELTGAFNRDLVEPVIGEGGDGATYELEQAIAAAKGKALILWKK